MNEIKIVGYNARNSLQILSHGVNGVSKRDENDLALFGVRKNREGHAYFDWSERFMSQRSRRCSRKRG